MCVCVLYLDSNHFLVYLGQCDACLKIHLIRKGIGLNSHCQATAARLQDKIHYLQFVHEIYPEFVSRQI